MFNCQLDIYFFITYTVWFLLLEDITIDNSQRYIWFLCKGGPLPLLWNGVINSPFKWPGFEKRLLIRELWWVLKDPPYGAWKQTSVHVCLVVNPGGGYFKYFFIFTPNLGEDSHCWLYIFQMPLAEKLSSTDILNRTTTNFGYYRWKQKPRIHAFPWDLFEWVLRFSDPCGVSASLSQDALVNKNLFIFAKGH